MSDSESDGTRAVVIDTSVFVAAAFRPRSDSGRVVEAVRAGRLRLVWDGPTRRETEHVLRKIPPIDWESVSGLFVEAQRFQGETEPSAFGWVPDEEDRKFAALAAAAGVPLVTLDRPLLGASNPVGRSAGSVEETGGGQHGDRAGPGPSFVALRPGAFLES